MSEPLRITVVASAGEFRAAKVYLPGDMREEHPRKAWCCQWCDWVCVAPSLAEVPPHACLSVDEGVRRVF